MLQRTEALRSLASPDAEPHGLLRIGLAHALAERTLIEPMFSFQILTCWITEDCRESPSMRFNFTAKFC